MDSRWRRSRWLTQWEREGPLFQETRFRKGQPQGNGVDRRPRARKKGKKKSRKGRQQRQTKKNERCRPVSSGQSTEAAAKWRTSPDVPCRHSWRHVFPLRAELTCRHFLRRRGVPKSKKENKRRTHFLRSAQIRSNPPKTALLRAPAGPDTRYFSKPSSLEPPRIIVSSLSGPVEIPPISTSVSSSK